MVDKVVNGVVVPMESWEVDAYVAAQYDGKPVTGAYRWQFIQALVDGGYISQADGEAWLYTNTLPAAVDAAVDATYTNATLNFRARVLLQAAHFVEKEATVIEVVRQALGMTTDQLGAVIRAAAAISWN